MNTNFNNTDMILFVIIDTYNNIIFAIKITQLFACNLFKYNNLIFNYSGIQIILDILLYEFNSNK